MGDQRVFCAVFFLRTDAVKPSMGVSPSVLGKE
jgi:hypothetical protein